MIRKIVLLVILALLFSGCSGSNPKAKITSVMYVETINAGGVYYNFEGKDNIQITLDFTFDDNLASGLDQTSDDYRDDLFVILVKGAHFYYDDQEVELVYGYWPKEAGSNYAKEMTLFYVVPSDHSVQSLRFVYDGDVLGEGASSIDTMIEPEK
ncbi:MAG: hypothetical protein MUO76_16955 [Anaerolineaceae bacterium]|nr:hypothetical protein [Anaerolineaceae bacterium]